ncbi:unnamed protein product [Symbiodinium sp. CCMP2592]|nr:unnamed protein product [Symbiodinium sp. CCMP2592]
MGVSHSMDREQVDEVLTQFEATTASIKGIESKMSKVNHYMEAVQAQRRNLSAHAEVTSNLIDGLGASIADQSEAIFDYFTSSFDYFAGLVETLETSLFNLKLQDAPRQMQQEFGPLLMPAVVLMVIITGSNCYFGFLLASDDQLSAELIAGVGQSTGNSTADSTALSEMNILNLFAIGHVVLIGLAVVYIVIDLLRRRVQRQRRKRNRRGRRRSTGSIVLGSDSDEDELAEKDEAGAGAHSPSLRAQRNLTDASAKTESTIRTPVSQMLRRLQQVATKPIHSEVQIKKFFSLSAPDKSQSGRTSQDWLGECRICVHHVDVHVAATATSQVLQTLHAGKNVHVVQAIRGGRGKVWGRLTKPPGWILLADSTTGYAAASKVSGPAHSSS